MSTLDIAAVRQHFPALARTHAGLPVAYFDGPGGTQVPQQVVAAMQDYLLNHNANSGWAYPTSTETDGIIHNARCALADFLNASPNEVAFGPNMTTLTYHLGRALAPQLAKGDEILVTNLDHHANIDPWKRLAAERGVTIRTAKFTPETGQLDWANFESKLSSATRIVAIGAASNALGTINDLGRAADLARQAGATLFVDAVHYAPHELVDVKRIGCDFLACSAYKFYGPHLGVLYGRQDLLASLDFPHLVPAHHEAPEVAETGTPNFEAIAGSAAAVDFLASFGTGESRRAKLADSYKGLQTHGKALLQQLWHGLRAIEGVTVYGPPPEADRTPTLSFTVSHVPPRAVASRLAELAVFASTGDFYALTVVERLGLAEQGGLVRAGCACYTTEEEVDRLVTGVRQIAHK